MEDSTVAIRIQELVSRHLVHMLCFFIMWFGLQVRGLHLHLRRTTIETSPFWVTCHVTLPELASSVLYESSRLQKKFTSMPPHKPENLTSFG
jgi:hypothetical protein